MNARIDDRFSFSQVNFTNVLSQASYTIGLAAINDPFLLSTDPVQQFDTLIVSLSPAGAEVPSPRPFWPPPGAGSDVPERQTENQRRV
ncbi:MAG: hypothetical protein ACRD8O_22335 [Bryobacteraceae bacterium]